MSGDLEAGSCPTYSLEDMEQKKPQLAIQESSADAALPAADDNRDEKKIAPQQILEKDPLKKEESQPKYSALQMDSRGKYKKGESAVTFSQLCLIVSVIGLTFLILAVAISVGVSYAVISRFRSEINSGSKASESLLNEELVSSLQYELEILQNETQSNSFQLSENTMDIKSTNTSIFNTFQGIDSYLLDFISYTNSNLLELMNQLNESTTKLAALNERISLIETMSFGKSMFYPAPSCQTIHLLQPSPSSGYYWVLSSNGSSIRVYCDMIKSCGNITGGLTRVALLNNETRPLICTGDIVTVNDNRRCARNTEELGCSHIIFPLMNISYSHICGTVEGSWFGHPDGFTGTSRSSSTTINDNYVDGISLTYGNTSSRTHIWTFFADQGQNNQCCPHSLPDYVGNDYSCLKWVDSCSSSLYSCSHMFFSQLQQPTTEDIEMRLCRDQHRYDEGIYLGNVEMYVW